MKISLFLLLVFGSFTGSTWAETEYARNNQDNVVWCDSCNSYINQTTGAKVPMPKAEDTVKSSGEAAPIAQ